MISHSKTPPPNQTRLTVSHHLAHLTTMCLGSHLTCLSSTPCVHSYSGVCGTASRKWSCATTHSWSEGSPVETEGREMWVRSPRKRLGWPVPHKCWDRGLLWCSYRQIWRCTGRTRWKAGRCHRGGGKWWRQGSRGSFDARCRCSASRSGGHSDRCIASRYGNDVILERFKVCTLGRADRKPTHWSKPIIWFKSMSYLHQIDYECFLLFFMAW